jgi:amino acid transporter
VTAPRPETTTVYRSHAGEVSARVERRKLGLTRLTSFAVSGASPMLVAIVAIPTILRVTGFVAIPAAYLAALAVLWLFTTGFVAMARHVNSPGAFYIYICRGLGPTAGVVAGFVAWVAYTLMLCGLYGAVGVLGANQVRRLTGWPVGWQAVAVAAWLLVAVLGARSISLNGTVVTVLLVAEIAVVVVFDVVMITHPAGRVVAPWDPAVTNPGQVFTLLVVAFAAFVGYESTVIYTRAARDPARTMPGATKLALLVPGVLLAFTATAIISRFGPGAVVGQARVQQSDLVFRAVRDHLPGPVVGAGYILLLTSVLAALLSFHNAAARYTYILARDGVMPRGLTRTSPRTLAPVTASMAQSGVVGVVLVGYAAFGDDPLRTLFGWLTTVGGLGVLFLMTATSLAVLAYFRRQRSHGEGRWRTVYAPAIALVLLTLASGATVVAFGPLLDVGSFTAAGLGFPALYGVVAVLAVGFAGWLRRWRPDAYALIGQGADRAVAL